ncbi:MAG TPA: recombinase family protein [Ruminococcus flavefaciens]|nr:recombinase family protein [Ruminococcus flavefaciens]
MCSYQVDRIFSEKISGANKDRPQLRAMLDYLQNEQAAKRKKNQLE